MTNVLGMITEENFSLIKKRKLKNLKGIFKW